MARIYYSMSGEGRGHAARVQAMTERLRGQHQLTLFAPGDAYRFLAPVYAGTEVRVEPLPGLLFAYATGGQLDYRRTVHGAWRYARQFSALKQALRARMQEDPPDLVITDFEPALPRAAKQLGIPFVSLNHQHFLCTYDLRTLPLWLRSHAAYMRAVVKLYYSGQQETIVSSFYFPPLRPPRPNVTQVGVLLRPEFERIEPVSGNYLLAYCRRHARPETLAALQTAGRPVRVYGLGDRGTCGNLTFLAIDPNRFLEDLAGCQALVTTAGNQLVGEALFLRKPVLAMPEPANYEQFINAHFLRQSGCGDWLRLDQLTPHFLAAFLSRLDEFREQIRPDHMNGVPRALAVVRRCLPNRRPAAAGQPAPVGA